MRSCSGPRNPPVTVHLGPDAIMVAMEFQFVPQASSGDVTEAIDRIEHAIHARYWQVQQIYVEAESIRRTRE